MTLISITHELINRAFVEFALVLASSAATIIASRGWRRLQPRWPKQVEVTIKLRW